MSMINWYPPAFKRVRRRFLCLIVAALVAAYAGAGSSQTHSFVQLGGFSPDGTKLAVRFCSEQITCRFGYADLARRRFIELRPSDTDQEWSPGGFSPNGQWIAVTIRRRSEEGRFSQVGIVSVTTGRLEQLTVSENFKASPFFSHDGKKIIFAQSNRERETGATRFSDWDIYEITLDKPGITRLTAYSFFQISPPAYLPGDLRFIFSGEAPRLYTAPSGSIGHRAYSQQYQANNIFIFARLAKDKDKPLVPIFTNGVVATFPSISADGSAILYHSRTDQLDGVKTRYTYDLFIFDGKDHRRLTKLDAIINQSTLSSDGRTAAFVVSRHTELRVSEVNLLDLKSGHLKSLDFLQGDAK